MSHPMIIPELRKKMYRAPTKAWGGAMHRLSATLGKKAEAFDMNCVRVSSTVNVILFRPLTAPLIQFIKDWSNTHWNHIEPKILAIYQKDTYLLLLNKKETNIFLIF